MRLLDYGLMIALAAVIAAFAITWMRILAEVPK